jgi:hypothetical protein
MSEVEFFNVDDTNLVYQEWQVITKVVKTQFRPGLERVSHS